MTKIVTNRIWTGNAKTQYMEMNFPQQQMMEILHYFANNIPSALETATRALPEDFSPGVEQAISTNMLKLHARLVQSL